MYLRKNFDTDLWGWPMAVFMTITCFVGLMIMRYAPGGDGTMTTAIAVSLDRYIFIQSEGMVHTATHLETK